MVDSASQDCPRAPPAVAITATTNAIQTLVIVIAPFIICANDLGLTLTGLHRWDRNPENDFVNSRSHEASSVLVFDDNRNRCQGLTELLTRQGFEIYTEFGGTEGIACARSIHPDALLLDLHMLNMDGVEVTAVLRKIHPWRRSQSFFSPWRAPRFHAQLRCLRHVPN
ncbi:response regulator [Terriglobus sp. TAA 43]|uniref:response regulator n=1 Tax=Terriglobus sp. TAA 43 TaxID=278961 RepID=UPI0018DDE6F0